MLSQTRKLLDRFSLLPRGARLSADRRDRRTTLSVEVLEGRLAPASDTWSGAGAIATLANPNPNWSDAQNWVGNVAPRPGDALVFPSGAKAKVANNDYAPGTAFASLSISGDGYQITGNLVQLQGGITNSFGFNTVALPLTLTAAQTFTDAANYTLDLAGSINNGGHLLTISDSGNVLFTGSSISGSGGLTLEGNGFTGKLFLQDRAPDSYTGVTSVTAAGVLVLDGAQGDSIVGNLVAGVGTGPVQNDVVRLALSKQIADTSNVTVSSDGLLDLEGFSDTIGSLTMSGGYVVTGTGTLTLNGNVTTQIPPAGSSTAWIEDHLALATGFGPHTFTVAGGTDLYVPAVVSGGPGAELIKAGPGTMRLGADNTYAGQTVVSAGTLTAASADALGSAGVTVNGGAVLESDNGSLTGAPAFSTLVINGNLANAGVVDMDGAGTVSTLAIHGNYTQAAAATLEMAVANANAFDQVTISGTATLAGTLDVSPQNGFQPAAGNQFPIMTFASSAGKFTTVDLPHPNVLSLRYDPRDLTIVDTATSNGGGSPPSLPPHTDIWTGAGANDNWTNPLNWSAHVAPTPGDTLYFPAAPTATASNNNYTPCTTFASIIIAGIGYKITGNAVTLQNGLTAGNGSGPNTVALPLAFSASEIITAANPGATLVVSGSLNNDGNLLTVDAVGNVLFNGPSITGSGGLAVEGNGTCTLADTAPDTYTGPTQVHSGTLAIANAGALSSATTVDAGATLQLVGGLTISAADSLTLNGFGVNGAGALQAVSGNDTWNGTISLASTTAIATSAGTTLTIGASPTSAETTQGVINGPYTSNLYYEGSGTVVLAGADSYLGYTTVAGGILALDNLNALTGAPYYGGRGTSVDAGATLQLWAAGTYALDPLGLNGSGVGGMGALENMTGNNTWQGPIRLNGNTTMASAAGSTLTTKAEIGNEGYLLTVNAVGNVDFAGFILGAGGLTKNGPCTLTFSNPAPNLYAGATVINAGTLLLAKAAGVSAITGAGVTIDAAATLAGSGTIDANVTNYGLVSPGGAGATGTLTINGNYTQMGSGNLDIGLASTTAIDQLMISGLATLAGTLNVSLLNGFVPKSGDSFEIMTYGSYSGKFGTVNFPNSGDGIVYGPHGVTIEAEATSPSQ
ncbi:MAG TPA: autotransporter-associated beta strand repeat-containing protein [Gemmataceae bacterium]|nr:autotransporter-associated beta strand repeat-containing protein [Gemmataceae bacterium]